MQDASKTFDKNCIDGGKVMVTGKNGPGPIVTSPINSTGYGGIVVIYTQN